MTTARTIDNRRAVVCRECGARPAPRRDDVSAEAVEYLCSRCCLGLGPVGRAKRAARQGGSSPERAPDPAGDPVRTEDLPRDDVGTSGGVRKPGRRRRWLEKQIAIAGGLEVWRRKERERIRALRAGHLSELAG